MMQSSFVFLNVGNATYLGRGSLSLSSHLAATLGAYGPIPPHPTHAASTQGAHPAARKRRAGGV